MRSAITHRQLHVLFIVLREAHAHCCPPTLQEIGDELCIKKNAVLGHLQRLVKKGLIEWDRGKARSIRLKVRYELWEQPC